MVEVVVVGRCQIGSDAEMIVVVVVDKVAAGVDWRRFEIVAANVQDLVANVAAVVVVVVAAAIVVAIDVVVVRKAHFLWVLEGIRD